MYPTNLASWSKVLNWKTYSSFPFYDCEAHDRGFEFHAWLNPYEQQWI
jgi:uncharacterized lipoprotein YddW (UPF0748 family)